MNQPISYDAEDLIRQMREASTRALDIAKLTVTDPKVMAGFHAQMNCLPARECFARVHLGLREAGHDDTFIGAVAGALAGAIIWEVLLNSADPERVWNVFCRNLNLSVSGKDRIGESTISIPGVTAGRA